MVRAYLQGDHYKEVIVLYYLMFTALMNHNVVVIYILHRCYTVAAVELYSVAVPLTSSRRSLRQQCLCCEERCHCHELKRLFDYFEVKLWNNVIYVEWVVQQRKYVVKIVTVLYGIVSFTENWLSW